MCECNGVRWTSAAGWDGFYEVSTCGSVRSVDRWIVYSTGRRQLYRSQPMRVTVSSADGYHRLAFRRRDRSWGLTVHSLVLEAFIGPRPEGAECRHLDGNPGNNHLTNLAWGTCSENQYDRVRHGTHPEAGRKVCPRGHLLAVPNIVACRLREGTRECLACNRAYGIISRARRSGRIVAPLEVLARIKYNEIMGSELTK